MLCGSRYWAREETALGANAMVLNAITTQALSWLDSEAGYAFGSGGDRGLPLNYANDKRRQHPALKAIPVKAPVEEAPRWRTWATGFDGSWKLAGEEGSAAPTCAIILPAVPVASTIRSIVDLLVGLRSSGGASGFSVPALADLRHGRRCASWRLWRRASGHVVRHRIAHCRGASITAPAAQSRA